MDVEQRNALVMKYYHLVPHVCKRVYRQSIHQKYFDYDDALQIGYVALINAAEHYDSSRTDAARFVTYAFCAIRRTILDAISKGELIKMPKDVRNAIRSPEARRQFAEKYPGRARFLAHAEQALNADSGSEQEILELHTRRECWEEREECEELQQAVDKLSSADHVLLEKYFGLNNCMEESPRELAQARGISRAAISYHINRILELVYKHLVRARDNRHDSDTRKH